MTAGENIKRYREGFGWTQQQLADKLTEEGRRTSRAAIAQWELGQTHPRPGRIALLSQIFHKPMGAFARFGSDDYDDAPPAHPNPDRHYIQLLKFSEIGAWFEKQKKVKA